MIGGGYEVAQGIKLYDSFLKTGKTDLASFIEWWEIKGKKRSVPAPSGQDAIRVMTIHKAKGLGIPVVILPFFETELDHANTSLFPQIMWCKSTLEPFSNIPLLPVKYSSSLENTIFSEEYSQEKVKAYVDNLNVAYVALTRAEREIAIFAQVPADKSKSSVSRLMYNLFSGRLDGLLEFDTGEWTKADAKDDQQ